MMGLMVSFGGCGEKGPQGQTLEVKTKEWNNGNVKKEYQFFRNGEGKEVKHGYYKEYYKKNGQIKSEGNHKDDGKWGAKDGKWVEYYKNGQIKSEGNYKLNYKLKEEKESEVAKSKKQTKSATKTKISGCWQTHQVVDCFEGKSVTRYFLTEALQMQSNPRADLDGGITGPWTGNYYVQGDKVTSNFSQGNPNYMGSHVSIHEEFTVKSKSDNTISITMKSGTNAQMIRRTDSQFRYGLGAMPVYKENSINTQELLDVLEGWADVEGSYKDGKWVEYYSGGEIWYERNYKDGKEDGKWVRYDGEGNIANESCYDMGKSVDCP